MGEKGYPIRVEAAVKSSGHNLVRWRPDVAGVPTLIAAVDNFVPVDLPAAHACTEWFRSHSLNVPAESVTWLYVRSSRLLGFFALANGQVQLAKEDRQDLDVRFRTQPAILITQVAREATEPGAGEPMMVRALGLARRANEYSAATVLALDPHDDETAEMWREKYRFRNSELQGPGRPEHLKRLWIPLVAAAD